jgi:hypothetical protein
MRKLFIQIVSKIKGPTTLDRIHTDSPNLIDMGNDLPTPELLSRNVFELFDPLKQPNRPHSWPTKLNQAGTDTHTPPFVTPSTETPSPLSVTSLSSPSYPYPIKLRLKLTAFPEIKPFCQLVQQIRNENQTKQVEFSFSYIFTPLDILSANTFTSTCQ